MSASSADSDSGGEEATINGDARDIRRNGDTVDDGDSQLDVEGGRISELLQEEQERPSTPEKVTNGTNRYKATRDLESASEDGSLDAIPRGVQSPMESVMSIPDDSPSVQVGNKAKPME
jgi:hypothetical protein